MERVRELSAYHLFFLWFGAAVSVAEILTGGLLAGMGWERGMVAIIIGHLIGTALLAMAGVIGFYERLPAIHSMRISFGRRGSYMLSGLNVLQLIGWTAVMVLEGGRALTQMSQSLWGFGNQPLSCLIIGLLVTLWVFMGVRGLKTFNSVAVLLLFGLTIVLSTKIFGDLGETATAGQAAPFSLGLELSIIMPLSWFPLIADYTSRAKSTKAAWLAPFCGYFIGSCWMYAIGLAGALHSGSADPATMMLAARMGLIALAVIGLSTVTTTFLDVFSAAESSRNVFSRLDHRLAAVGFALLGTLLAIVIPMERYIDFLLLIGSVFAPLIAIFLSDYFIFRVDSRTREFDKVAALSLLIGFISYHIFARIDPPMGQTLCTIALTGLVHAALRRIVFPSRIKG
jgi:putative hydroxymethylpyrimidine transporter CytX